MEEVAHIECPLCRSRLMDATKAITKITHIDVLSATELMIYFKDGRKISRIWESKTKRGESSGKNSNDNTRYDK